MENWKSAFNIPEFIAKEKKERKITDTYVGIGRIPRAIASPSVNSDAIFPSNNSHAISRWLSRSAGKKQCGAREGKTAAGSIASGIGTSEALIPTRYFPQTIPTPYRADCPDSGYWSRTILILLLFGTFQIKIQNNRTNIEPASYTKEKHLNPSRKESKQTCGKYVVFCANYDALFFARCICAS